MHSKGLIHGDVNPRNILLCPNVGAMPLGFTFKLADFGLSKRLRPEQEWVDGIR